MARDHRRTWPSTALPGAPGKLQHGSSETPGNPRLVASAATAKPGLEGGGSLEPPPFRKRFILIAPGLDSVSVNPAA